MIDPDTAFSVAGLAALIGWSALVVSLFVPRLRKRVWQATGMVIPGAIAAAYILLIATGLGQAGGTDFGSIAEVRRLFANDAALAAGWLHYLAFDMFVGTWIARDGTGRGISSLLLLPCLVLTFLLGPAGLLLYLAIRLAVRNQSAPETAA